MQQIRLGGMDIHSFRGPKDPPEWTIETFDAWLLCDSDPSKKPQILIDARVYKDGFVPRVITAVIINDHLKITHGNVGSIKVIANEAEVIDIVRKRLKEILRSDE